MGIERHLRPLRVHQATSLLLDAGIIAKEPPWYRVIASNPPSTSLVRVKAVKLKPVLVSKKKSKNFYQPQNITYSEDQIRHRFYKDHPWELARPRIVVENDGQDYTRNDWNENMSQKARQLDGESVVQRTLAFENGALGNRMDRNRAYLQACKEFYELRMHQDIERRIAIEEAESTGAVFGKSYLQVGMEVEQNVLAKWKEAAKTEALTRKRRAALNSGSALLDEDDEGKDELEKAE